MIIRNLLSEQVCDIIATMGKHIIIAMPQLLQPEKH